MILLPLLFACLLMLLFHKTEVRAVVSSNDKQRFAIVDGRIRANQGHTFPVDDAELLTALTAPLALVVHGTYQKA